MDRVAIKEIGMPSHQHTWTFLWGWHPILFPAFLVRIPAKKNCTLLIAELGQRKARNLEDLI